MTNEQRACLRALYLVFCVVWATTFGPLMFPTPAAGAPPSANMQYSNLQISGNDVYAGDSVDVTATVENVGDSAGNYDADLTVDGTVEDTKSGTLSAGANTDVTFSYTYSSGGEFSTTIEDLPSKTVAVSDPISYSGLSVSDTTVYAGNTADISATLTNDDQDGSHSYTAELKVAGNVQDTKTGSLAAGANTQVSFTHTFDSVGNQEVTIDGLSAQTVTVQDPISYSDLSIGDTTVAEGESFDVSATLTNNDDYSSHDYTAELKHGGNVQSTKTGTLAAGANTQVTFSDSIGSAGNYAVTIDGLDAQTVTVQTPISYSGLSVSANTVTAGSSIDVSATLANNDDSNSQSYSAKLKVAGNVQNTKTGTLAASANTQVTFTYTMTTVGNQPVTIDGLSAQTVTVQDPINYSGLSIADTTVAEGESFDVSTTISNQDGTTSRSYTAELKHDGSVVDSKSGTLAAGANTQVTFSDSIDTAGNYAVTVDGLAAQTVDVQQPISYSSLSITDTTVATGESFDVSATLTNNDDSNSRSYTAELKVAGNVQDTKTGTLAAGANTQVTFSHSFDSAGNYAVTIDGLSAESVLVQESLSYSGLTISDTNVAEGESFDVSATITNNDDSNSRSYTAELKHGGNVQSTKSGNVAAGGSTQVTFSDSFGTAGNYAVTIDGLDSQTVTVQKPISYSSLSVSANTVTAGDSIDVSATLTNNDDSNSQSYSAKLKVAGNVQDTKTGTLAAAGNTQVTFTYTMTSVGNQPVTIDGLASQTVVVQDPITYSGLSITDTTVATGESFDVSATVTNEDGTTSRGYTAELKVAGNVQDTKTGTLAAGANTQVTFSHSFDSAGNYAVTIDGLSAESVVVQETFTYSGLSVSDRTVAEDESFDVSATLTNNDDSNSRSYTAELKHGGNVVNSTTGSLSAGANTQVTFSDSFSSTGNYAVTIDGLDAQTVVVQEPISYSDLSIADTTVAEDESFNVSATLTNNDDSNSQSYTAELKHGGNVVDSKTGTLAAAGNTQVTFSDSIDTAGNYAVTIDGLSTRTVVVQEPIRYSSLSVSANTVTAGDSIDVSATLTNNDDDGSRSYTAELKVAGNVQDSKSGSIAAGGNTQVTFTYTMTTVGNQPVTIDGLAPQTVTVQDPISYSGLSVADTTVATGESFDVSATITNEDGTTSRGYTAELKHGGNVVDSKTGTLAVGANTQVTFSDSISSAGNYAVTIDGLSAESVVVQKPVSYSGLSVSDTTVAEGESFDVSATLTNNDDSNSRSYTAELKVAGNVQDTKTGTLAASGNTQVTFSHSFDSAGNYAVTIDGLDSQTVTVQEPISYSGLTVSDTTVAEGESFDVSATLTNNDDSSSRSYTAELKHDGSVVDSKSESLAAGGNAQVTFSDSIGTAGNYAVTIDGLSAESVVVQEPVSYSGLTVSETTVTAGDSIDVSATLTNNDDSNSQSYTAELKVAGNVQDTKTGTLAAAGNTQVTFTYTTSTVGNQPVTIDGLDAQTVVVQDPIAYSGLTVSDTSIYTDNTVDVTATITNEDGTSSRSYTAELKHDGSVVDSKSGTLAAGANTQVTFEDSFSSAGNYAVTIDGLSAESVVVEEPIGYSGLSISDTTVAAGESFDVSASITNDDDANSHGYTAELKHDGTVVDSKSGTLAAGANTQVTFEDSISSAGNYAVTIDGISTQSVVVQETFTYSGLAVSASTVYEDESFDVSATITSNDDSVSRSYTAELKHDGSVVDSKTGTLAAGANTQVTFSDSISSAGTYAVTIDGLSTQSVVVQDPISYSGLSVSSTSISTGESVDVSATITNEDATSGQSYTADLLVDGSVDDSKSGTVAADGSTTVTFTRTFSSSGDYDVAIADLSAKTVSVSGSDGGDDGTTEDGGSGDDGSSGGDGGGGGGGLGGGGFSGLGGSTETESGSLTEATTEPAAAITSTPLTTGTELGEQTSSTRESQPATDDVDADADGAKSTGSAPSSGEDEPAPTGDGSQQQATGDGSQQQGTEAGTQQQVTAGGTQQQATGDGSDESQASSGTQASGPGFGFFVALISFLGAALLLQRRRVGRRRP